MDIDEITIRAVERLRLQPGDSIIVTVAEPPTAHQQRMISDSMRHAVTVAGLGNVPVIIKHESQRIAILGPNGECVTEAIN